MLARVGGNEFVYLAAVLDADAAAALATKVGIVLDAAMNAGTRRLSASASIGISLYPQGGNNLDGLLQNADAAVHEFRGRNINGGFQFFNEAIGEAGAVYQRFET